MRTGSGTRSSDWSRTSTSSWRCRPRPAAGLDRTPLAGDPIWVDDPRFNLAYHVRHTSLPVGAGERELKRLAGRILSQQLDRGKPLWEMWFVEGCGEGRFALVHEMPGPGYFHLILRGDGRELVDLYFGKGETLLKSK